MSRPLHDVLSAFASPCTVFYLLRYTILRDLHSFPTRRSSDLPGTSSMPCSASRARLSESSTRASVGPGIRRSWSTCGVRGRSEEHTSELQSPCNLVCRLLLEKKKLIYYWDSTEYCTDRSPFG